jgi:hypothetical protein
VLSPIAGAVLFASNVYSPVVGRCQHDIGSAPPGSLRKGQLAVLRWRAEAKYQNANERSPFCLLVSNGDVFWHQPDMPTGADDVR